MNGNDFVRLVLQSPLHSLVPNTVLITVTGRRTGRKITIPVNYYRDGADLWIVSTRSRTWWRNLRGGNQVRLRLEGKDVEGFAETFEDAQSVALRIGEYVRRLPVAARAIGVGVVDGVPNREDAARAAMDRLFVRVRVSGAGK